MSDNGQNANTATPSTEGCGNQLQSVDGNSVTNCPNCWYNLTGLPSNRCPECGIEITPEHIKELADDYSLAFEPISWKQVAKRLLVVPLAIWFAFLVLGLLVAFAPSVAVMVFTIVLFTGVAGGFFIAMGLSFVVADQFASRLCYRTGRPLNSPYRHFVSAMLELVLLAFQVVVSMIPMLVLMFIIGPYL